MLKPIPVDDVYDISFGPVFKHTDEYRRTVRIRTGQQGQHVVEITLMSQLEFKLAMLAKPHVGQAPCDATDDACELCGCGGCDDNDGQYHWHERCRAQFIREYNNYLDADLIVAMTNADVPGQLIDDLAEYLAGDRDAVIDKTPIF